MVLTAPEIGPDANHPFPSSASVAHLKTRPRVGIRSVQHGDDDLAIVECPHQAFKYPLGTIRRVLEVLVVALRKEHLERRSAHDLRRLFGTRWAKRVMPAVLQRLMCHAAVSTKMKYYVTMDFNTVADEL